MTGPLAQQFAQVREALNGICPQEYAIDCDLPEHQTARDGHAALSSIERHVQEMEGELGRWLAWSSGEYPDDSPGDVIHATSDGTIVLDDGITTWNPLRALQWIERRREDNAARAALPAREKEEE